MESWKVGKLGIINDIFVQFSLPLLQGGHPSSFPNLEIKYYSLVVSVLLCPLFRTDVNMFCLIL